LIYQFYLKCNLTSDNLHFQVLLMFSYCFRTEKTKIIETKRLSLQPNMFTIIIKYSYSIQGVEINPFSIELL
jgi:hypothetical protein